MKARTALFVLAVAVVRALPASAEIVKVFAASSLAEPFTELGRRFAALHPGNTVEFNFAGSQTLRTQIEQGAPADVCASADLLHMQALMRESLVGNYTIFATNSLCVVTPASAARVRSLADLARPRVRLTLAGENVPAGRYADQVLRSMDASGRYGRDFRRRVLANTVSREPDVRAALSKVVLGEADASMVYVTDARTARGRVRVLAIPARFNATAVYPVAVVTESRQKALAEAFVRLLAGPEGIRVLARHGFQPPKAHAKSR